MLSALGSCPLLSLKLERDVLYRACSVSDVPSAERFRRYDAGSRLVSRGNVFITVVRTSGYKATGVRVVAATQSPSSKKESSLNLRLRSALASSEAEMLIFF